MNSPEESGSAKPKRKIKKWPIVTGALIVVVAAGIGGFIWHEQPAFCGAICHTPMDAYLATFESEPGVAGTDKWGNAVENTSGMLSVTHNAHGKTCLNCHEPTIGEQINEGIKWVSGDYVFPLEEHTLTDLTAARGATADEFCLNDSCHHLASDGTVIKTRADLEATTAHLSRNPHVAQHQEFDCGTCHKAHRSSVMYCSSCHADSEIPAGWVSGQEELTLSAAR
ncbi:MAG TPA: salivary glue protein Sgs-3 [Coriobacteriia bacterium]|nr:salivary glue protein Sgs-3 [Coriobacteriia bacterium]